MTAYCACASIFIIDTPRNKKMASRNLGKKVIDWTKLSASIPAETRGEYNQFRARYEMFLARVNAYPETPQSIEWEHFKQGISKPGFVDSFQKQYEALKIPYPADTTSESLAQRRKEVDLEAQKVIAQSKLKAEELQKELDSIMAQKPLEDMTVDEYLADKPELREKAEKDTYNHVWHQFKS